MNPNGKKLKDHPIKVNLDFHEYHMVQNASAIAGVEPSKLLRDAALSNLMRVTVHEETIAIVNLANQKVELPIMHLFGTPKHPKKKTTELIKKSSLAKLFLSHKGIH